jgi:hypothetical protein
MMAHTLWPQSTDRIMHRTQLAYVGNGNGSSPSTVQIKESTQDSTGPRQND